MDERSFLRKRFLFLAYLSGVGTVQSEVNARSRTKKIRSKSEVSKRIIDITVAILVPITTWPLMLLFALLIRRDTQGPAIFKQTRIGINRRNGERRRNNQGNHPNERRNGKRRKVDFGGKPFTFYKFRTMFENAKELFPELYAYDYTPEEIKTMYFKSEDDPRLTPFGKKLRMTSLDELPNFINVIKGDMSLVGPRPEIPEMIKYYLPWQRLKFTVKPGVTGLAQTQGRGFLTFQETIFWDVKYVAERSLSTYFKIPIQTIWAVLKGIGAF